MNFELSLTQEQKLIMTQEMQLSVKLLQMSSLELQEYVEKEVQENPVLDYSEEKQNNNKNEETRIEYKELIKYINFDNYGHHYYEKDDEELSPFYFVHEKETLTQFLLGQLNDIKIDKILKVVCIFIINSLDDKGYLDSSIEEIANALNTNLDCVEKALKIVQSLEPAGIAARNLKECLLLQLCRKNILDTNLKLIVENHLEDIADNRYSNIAKSLDIDIKLAQSYGDQIKKLCPKPSSGFYTGDEVKYIVPDAFIRKVDDKLQVIMNEDIIPELKINEIYKDILLNEKDKEAVQFVKQKLDSAVFLIKSVEQRKTTVRKVLEKIVEIQNNYFETSDGVLKPMTLKDISEQLNLHESTVSRAVKDKFINIKKGTIRIKDLFTTGLLSKENNEEVSVTLIKKKIKAMIDLEDKRSPLSDQCICDILNEFGMNISRRTVAKYREELNIKASSKRKRF